MAVDVQKVEVLALESKYPLKVEVGSYRMFALHGDGLLPLQLPFKFYCYTLVPDEAYDYYDDEVILLSDMQKHTVCCYEFSNKKDYVDFIIAHPNAIVLLPYNVLLSAREPNYFDGFSAKLNTMFLDIEVLTTGKISFPTPDVDQIFLIVAIYNNTVKVFFNVEDEKQLLIEFIEYFNQCNPNIVCGYNIKSFDLPFLLKRCLFYGISQSVLNARQIPKAVINKEGCVNSLYGRVVYDVFEEVKKDNTLRVLRDRKLKTVAAHFKYNCLDLSSEVKSNLKRYLEQGHKEDVISYCISDVYSTITVYNVYARERVLLADDVKVSFDAIVNNSQSFVPNLIHARGLLQLGIIGDKKNEERFAEHIIKYGGALVGIKKQGLFKPVWHQDFSGMYSSIIITFNLSPETVFFMGFEAKREFYSEEHDEHRIISFYDHNYRKNVILKILKKQGFLPAKTKETYIRRKAIKSEYQKTGDLSLYAKQNVLKLQLNTTYGLNGTKFTKWGNWWVGVATAGLGRLLMQLALDKYDEYLIEWDTDGMYLDHEVDVAVSEELIRNFVRKAGFEPWIFLDLDKYDAGYFYKEKNYVLKKKDKLVIHGSKFRASNLPLFISKFYKEIFMILLGAGDAKSYVKAFKNLRVRTLQDFVQAVKISDDPFLKTTGSIVRRLAMQMQKRNLPIERGTSIQYVATTDKFTRFKILEDVKSERELDFEYYRKRVSRVLEDLELNNLDNKTLKDFM